MADIEKLAQDFYSIKAHGNLLTVTAQDLRDIFDFALLHMRELEQEAQQASEAVEYNRAMDERNRIAYEHREKPWLPGTDE